VIETLADRDIKRVYFLAGASTASRWIASDGRLRMTSNKPTSILGLVLYPQHHARTVRLHLKLEFLSRVLLTLMVITVQRARNKQLTQRVQAPFSGQGA